MASKSTNASEATSTYSEIDHLWSNASSRERHELKVVYRRLLSVPVTENKKHVRFAEYIAILEEYEHNGWPVNFLLHGIISSFQSFVTTWNEADQVDAIQRRSYMQLIMAGRERHRDVAYGLSDKLEWTNQRIVIEQLVAMGCREHKGTIPVNHEQENGVLHVAVSYKHRARYQDGGTMSEEQAYAVWNAVAQLPFFDKAIGVRVWVDQNLHRAEFPEGTEWHEYGLLPYACLPIVFIGDGDCSLGHAATRPWLWVELLVGVKANGVHVVSGHDALTDAQDVLKTTEGHEEAKSEERSLANRISLRDVDDVMLEVARIVALWRPKGFLNHEGYEYADYFQRFVNWARRFVIRGCPYSKMRWNHNSEPVIGMDAVVLVRCLPRGPDGCVEISTAFIEPILQWKCAEISEEPSDACRQHVWTVGDLFDRTEIDSVPINLIVETESYKRDNTVELVILGKEATANRIRFRKAGTVISTVICADDAFGMTSRSLLTRYSRASFFAKEQMKGSTSVARINSTRAGDLITYRPFTERFMQLKRGAQYVSGDAELLARMVPEKLQNQLKLDLLGVCFNSGITEGVYRMGLVDNFSIVLSTHEIYALLAASKRHIAQFAQLASVLKKNCSYKQMIFDDLSDEDLRETTGGWIVNGYRRMLNEHIVSGEPSSDVFCELIEERRRQKQGYTLVSVLNYRDHDGKDSVRIVYRESRRITQLHGEAIGARWQMSAVQLVDGIELVDENACGALQLLMRMTRWKDEQFMSGVHLKMLDGLFARCCLCEVVVCCINGLSADLRKNGDTYLVQWCGLHLCEPHKYEKLPVETGIVTHFKAAS